MGSNHRLTFALKRIFLGICASLLLMSGGCASKFTSDFADSLGDAIRNNNDLETVRTGSPAYLLLIDALVGKDPDNPSLLRQSAFLHATYAEVFVDDAGRAGRLTDKALDLALAACCEKNKDLCSLDTLEIDRFNQAINESDNDDIEVLFTLGSSWAAWISAHQSEMKALAQIPRITAIMQRVVELDEGYMEGGAHLYLGTIAILLPPALGGRPDEARDHFEKAIELSSGKNLMAKVMYARQYARMMYDRELHDRLLTEVLETDPEIPGYTLMNTLAHQQARQLLDTAEAYF